MVAALVLLLVAFGLLIRNNHAEAKHALDERLESRAALTAEFTREYVQEIADRERAQAERLLAGPVVGRDTFEQVVQSFGFEAAVLLDDQGHLLHIWPRRSDLTGRDVTAGYPHLAAAVAGSVAVSPMVPSAADGSAVAAVATPFDSWEGRRVLSGAFSPASTPLGAYVFDVLSTTGGQGYLVDQSGKLLSVQPGQPIAPIELRLVPNGLTHHDTAEGRLAVTAAPVKGMPWRVVLAVPYDGWYGPVNEGRWAPWALLAVLALGGVVVVTLVSRLGRARAEAAHTARTDTLTGLPNRRAIDEMLSRAAAHARRHTNSLCVLMIDIDHFKTVNDVHGHATGDVVLKKVAEVLRGVGRDEDLAGRWGGEEFLIVLQATGIDGAVVAAERLRTAVAGMKIVISRGAPVQVTVSIGVAVLADDGTPEIVVRSADDALYRAKANGRNAVEVARVHDPDPIDLAPCLVPSAPAGP